jgi:apolipoprotein N-acyltransferase
MLIAAVNAAVAGIAAPVLRGSRPWRSAAPTAAAVVAAFLYGQVRLAQHYGTGDPIEVAVVQTGIAREVHGNPALQHERLDRYLELTRKAASLRPDIVFWPEYAIDFFLRDPSHERSTFLTEAQDLTPDLVLGGPDYRMREGSPHFYNSVFLLRSGHLAGRHDKIRLVPFAEYGPLGTWLRSDTAVYEPGVASPPLPARPARIGAFLCGEALYPDLVRELARQGAELLANPSNDYWLGEPEAAQQQVQVAAFRAIENRRYVVRATPTGTSAVIDPLGQIRVASQFGTSDLLFAQVYRSNAVTGYQLLGDRCVGAALLLLIASSLLAGRFRSSSKDWR